MSKAIEITDRNISYNLTDDKDILYLISLVRQGIKFTVFFAMAEKSPFSLNEWSSFLHISERTMQRYKREKKTFDPIYAQRILEITMLYQFGIDVFGTNEKFNNWLEATNLVLGGIKPKEFLDNSFGINLLKDELTRIEQGVLA